MMHYSVSLKGFQLSLSLHGTQPKAHLLLLRI